MVVHSLRRGEMENSSAVLLFGCAPTAESSLSNSTKRSNEYKSMHIAMRSSMMMIDENKRKH